MIKGSVRTRPLYEKWSKEKESHEIKMLDAILKAQNALENTYRATRTILERKKLIKNPDISTCIIFIESSLQLGKSLRNFQYFQNFSNQLKRLFHLLISLGETKIVEKFAEIIRVEEVLQKSPMGHTNGFHILNFTFDPFINELSHLHQVTDWKTVSKAWIAFDKLAVAERAWNSNSTDFDITNSDNDKIEQYIEWKDMLALKNATQNEKPIFFVRRKFIDYVEILISDILLYQEASLPSINEPKRISHSFPLQSIYLDCKFNKLFITVTGLRRDPQKKFKFTNFTMNLLRLNFLPF